MKNNDGGLTLLDDRIIIEEEIVNDNNYNKHLIPKEEYESEKKLQIDPMDLEDGKATLSLNNLGKYSINYLKGLKKDEKLFYSENELMRSFQNNAIYLEEFKDIGIFKFLTGSDKSGKTFSLLALNAFEKKDNYRIYLNDKYFSELEDQVKYEEILNVFFYEISKFFKTYDEYESFSKSFLEKNFEKGIQKIDFKDLLSKFIEEIDTFIQKNKDKYKKLMILIDDFELDERNQEKLKKNNKFINELYQKRSNESNIHFTFISPANDNYINKCILFALDIEKRLATTGLTKKDENSGIIYYPFIYYFSCFIDPKDNINIYQKKVKKYCEEELELEIPDDYLKVINYSLFHINEIKNMCQQNKDPKNIKKETEKYIKNLEIESERIILDFFSKDNGLFIFDIEKLKACLELIRKECVEYNELVEILNCISIRFINYFLEIIPIVDHLIEIKYKISYLYDFYGKSISKFIALYDNIDYETNKRIKPGQKGDCFEDKVTESIENGYFENFKPDKTVEIKSLHDLIQYDDDNENTKEKYIDIINKFENIFSNNNYKIIMITQKNPSAKKYDLAFLHQYKKGKYQLILIQITINKSKNDLLQYQDVISDCYNISNFFAIFDNIEIKRYHFLFIIPAKNNKNIQDMINFFVSNRIDYIKFGLDNNKKPTFLDSTNEVIKNIIFDKNSFSLVERINSYKIKEDDNLSSSSEMSYLGKKRITSSKLSKAKYVFGLNIYKKVLKILGCKNYELTKENFFLKENEYFYIHYKKGKNKEKVYYVMFEKEGQRIIQKIEKTKNNKENEDNEEIISEKDLEGTKFKCFRIIDDKDL